MDVRAKDMLHMKKPHPCGARTFYVIRAGMDFKLRCTGCGREMFLPRNRVERYIVRIERSEGEEPSCLKS